MYNRFLSVLLIFFVLYLIVKYISGFYIDYLWFSVNNGLQVFWVLFMTKFNVQMIFGISFIVLFMLNFLLIRILGGKGRFFVENFLDRIQIPGFGSSRKLLLLGMTVIIVFVGFIMGGTASAYWKEFLMYKNAVPFDGFPLDPIFNKNIGFYVFYLPFYNFYYTLFVFFDFLFFYTTDIKLI